ncbi:MULTISPECIES: hypothetical protein [Novosphingobium]|uniref:hypothetical protein n=1 Tax=Novosphingobium TaxID=165696 RepID=UPI000572F76A|nr:MULTISPECIES: hypothetical protein [Novosphingobium]GAM07495.1 hypothetical conserved protein [Novosphingobium sp. MBES04]
MGVMQILYFGFLATIFVAIGLSLWKGGDPERAGAGVLLIMFMMTWFEGALIQTVGLSQEAIRTISVAEDLVGLAGFGLIAARARRMWPIVCTAMELLSVLTHLVHYLGMVNRPIVVVFMSQTPTFTATVSLIVGTIIHIRRSQRFGPERDWQDFRNLPSG